MSFIWGYGPVVNWLSIFMAGVLLATYTWISNGYTFGDPCANSPSEFKQQCYQVYIAGPMQ